MHVYSASDGRSQHQQHQPIHTAQLLMIEHQDDGLAAQSAMPEWSACVQHLTLRLSNVHIDELWALHTEEVDAAFCSHGLCNQGLPCAYKSTAQPCQNQHV